VRNRCDECLHIRRLGHAKNRCDECLHVRRLGHARNRCDECLHMNDRESMNIYVCIDEQLRSAAASDRESHGEHSSTTIHPACMRGEWWAGVSQSEILSGLLPFIITRLIVDLVAFARLAFPENGTAQVTISRRSSVLKQQCIGKAKNESRRAVAWRNNQSAMNRMKQININMRWFAWKTTVSITR
jgi:hypothetical protein